MDLQHYSWDAKYEYRYTDAFPNFSKDGKLVITEEALNSSIAIMDADGSNRKRIFNADSGAAFMPTWSPDGQWIAFGYVRIFAVTQNQGSKNNDGKTRRNKYAGLNRWFTKFWISKLVSRW